MTKKTSRNPWAEPFPVYTGKRRPWLRFNPHRADAKAVRRNHPEWHSTAPTQFGRVIVGFSVGSRPVHDLADLERAWHDFTEANGYPRDVTIVPQRGAFTMPDGKVVKEDGATLTVLNLAGMDPGAFARMMRWFGAYVAGKFRQKEVIVQAGFGATASDTWGVRGFVPSDAADPEDAAGIEAAARADATRRGSGKVRRW